MARNGACWVLGEGDRETEPERGFEMERWLLGGERRTKDVPGKAYEAQALRRGDAHGGSAHASAPLPVRRACTGARRMTQYSIRSSGEPPLPPLP